MIKSDIIKTVAKTFALTALWGTGLHASVAEKPNVILIIADDLGVGDVGCYGAEKIATPNIDRMASGGVRALDARAPAAVCTPTRYAMMTGQYYHGDWKGELLVRPGQPTIASVLRNHGYATGCFGKWHLGWGRDKNRRFRADIDWNQPLPEGVLECGFDRYFGTPFSHNEPPFVFVRNREVVGADPDDPLTIDPPDKGHGKSRGGTKAHEARPDSRIDLVVTKEAQDWIRENHSRPFFMHLALVAPHVPLDVAEEFRGKSGAGVYGDFVQQMDWCVGEILRTLDECGIAENTLVIFSSDNGAVLHRAVVDAEHRSNLNWLGQKTDAWEGGVRVPFIARWPGRIPAGTTSGALVSLVDLCATTWAAAGVPVPERAAKDSINQLPVLLSPDAEPIRTEAMMLGTGGYAFRSGDWVYLPYQGSGGLTTNFEQPTWLRLGDLGRVNSDCDAAGRVKPDAPQAQLYDLKTDPAQSRNIFKDHPEKARQMAAQLDQLKRRLDARRNEQPGY